MPNEYEETGTKVFFAVSSSSIATEDRKTKILNKA